MKVLFLGNHAVGLYNFRKELIQHLIEQGYEVYFSVPMHDKVDRIIALGARYCPVNMNRRGSNIWEEIKLIRYYYKLLKELKPDVVLTYTIKPNIYAGMMSRLLNIKYITNITGLGSALQNHSFKRTILNRCYKIALKRADKVFFQNQGNRNYFLDNTIINENKAEIIPGSGVNIEHFKPRTNNSHSDKIIFLFIGRAMKEKGIDEYLEAAKYIKSKYINTEFQILGFYEEEQYKNRIDELHNKGIVVYLGMSDDTRVQIKDSDCIVLPSYHEGMSNVLLEAAAMEKPIMASNINGCKEAIEHSKNGFIFEPKNTQSLIKAIERFLTVSDVERVIMGKESRAKMIKEFDREIVIERYMLQINKLG